MKLTRIIQVGSRRLAIAPERSEAAIANPNGDRNPQYCPKSIIAWRPCHFNENFPKLFTTSSEITGLGSTKGKKKRLVCLPSLPPYYWPEEC